MWNLQIILLVGTKLQMIITEMALRIQDRGEVVKGAPVVEPGDGLFWFNRPRFILFLIHLVLFQVKFYDLLSYDSTNFPIEAFQLLCSEINYAWFCAAECISTSVFCLEHSKYPILINFPKTLVQWIMLFSNTILKKVAAVLRTYFPEPQIVRKTLTNNFD